MTGTGPAYHVVIEIRRQERRPDGTLDPRRDFVRRLVLVEAGIKVEEALTSEARTMSVLTMGKVQADAIEAAVSGLPS